MSQKDIINNQEINKTPPKKNNNIGITENQALKNHDKLINMQQSEARLHWQRNNVFLIVSSILLLSFSQFDDIMIQIYISSCALILNLGWLLIQWRSSSYIKVWKNEAEKLEQNFNIAPIYSGNIRGMQMRHIAYLLPIIFIALWSLLFFIKL